MGSSPMVKQLNRKGSAENQQREGRRRRGEERGRADVLVLREALSVHLLQKLAQSRTVHLILTGRLPRRLGSNDGRVGEVEVLAVHVHGVNAEAVDAAVEPEDDGVAVDGLFE